MIALPASVEPLFIRAGWHPGVASAVVDGNHHPATDMLREFDGLTVGSDGAGVECARIALKFQPIETLDEQIMAWERTLQTTMVGFAEGGLGYEEFYADEMGRIFAINCIVDGVYLCGFSFGDAVERLLLGRRAMPLLLEGQERVPFYGEDLLRGDPRIWTVCQLKKS